MVRSLVTPLFLAVFAGQVLAEERLTVELNKLEVAESGGCQAYFLFRNPTEKTLEGIEMALAVLDGNGVIDRLLTIDAAPIPALRTSLKLFEVPGMSCAGISEIILHDIPVCTVANSGPADCFGLIALESRVQARFVK